MQTLDRRYPAAAAVPRTSKGQSAMPASPLGRLLDDARALADQLVDDATTARDAVHAILGATLTRPPLPAPELYRVLDPLEQLLAELDQAVRQLGGSLSNGADLFDLTDDDPGTDPAAVIRIAVDVLDNVATHAYRGSLQLADARNTIAGQSYLPKPQQTGPVQATRAGAVR